MCGIAGVISRSVPIDQERLERFSRALARRGPDGEGLWREGTAGLVHRRLALVDLSERGAQPMVDASERYHIVFNGEIYNYQELREELEQQGVRFSSQSDTEVLLALFIREGTACLSRLRGMFAFAIWDRREKKLFFARDRIGKKPFFYRSSSDEFSFASEIKALKGDRSAEIDLGAIRLYFGLQYVPAPRTGFEGIFSLEPGQCGSWQEGAFETHTYASYVRSQDWAGSYEEAKQEMRVRIEESVRLRLRADVPVGIFLSGGLDSSLLASLMARQSKQPIETFTMGFAEEAYDERKNASEFAQQLGAHPHQFVASPEDVLAITDEVLSYYDAPFADSSCLPTWLLAQATKKSVKAVLTGDGGDEVFGGYTRYRYWLLGSVLAKLPASGGVGVAALLTKDPRVQRFSAFTKRLRQAGTPSGYAELFRGSYFSSQEETRLLTPAFQDQTASERLDLFFKDLAKRVGGGIGFPMNADLASYLPDDLNVKMDRATMAHGLEARCPLLDQEVISLALRLPIDWHLQMGRKKPFLEDVAKDLLPDAVWKRPKRGFRVPLAQWFRGPLRASFVEKCLTPSSFLATICQLPAMRQLLAENDRGMDRGNALWMLYGLASWGRIFS